MPICVDGLSNLRRENLEASNCHQKGVAKGHQNITNFVPNVFYKILLHRLPSSASNTQFLVIIRKNSTSCFCSTWSPEFCLKILLAFRIGMCDNLNSIGILWRFIKPLNHTKLYYNISASDESVFSLSETRGCSWIQIVWPVVCILTEAKHSFNYLSDERAPVSLYARPYTAISRFHKLILATCKRVMIA